ncbi:protein kinase superfamily protein [Artemisia annua]|uniref:Protein kinase superfamily protein n=1 Tax=Artemisia annua TaxID=35608 RepID=A0A2U1L4U4_ARTAN|nr:protein kinase superfamily protein [Artemisia annua]
MASIDLKEFQEKISTQFRPWQRSFQFWVRAADIYAGYKVFQIKVSFEKDVEKAEAMWERHHEYAADKIYNMCSDMGGFFLKVAQVVGKPDLAPAAWVRKLVTLCDQAPGTPSNVVRLVLEKELGRSVDEMFERFDWDPIGSASIAQVHRARIKGDKKDIVVKVQHPGVQDLMMTDLRNLQAFALCVQKTDLQFDFFSVCKEMEKQVNTNLSWSESVDCGFVPHRMLKGNRRHGVDYIMQAAGYEFDFTREADAMDRIRTFLSGSNIKTVVKVPRVIKDVVTRKVLAMEYIDGIPILNLKDEIIKRGIDPDGKIATAAKQNILKSLSLAYGHMILESGFFHADPHPGNILICKGSEKKAPPSVIMKSATLAVEHAAASDRNDRTCHHFQKFGIKVIGDRDISVN